MTYRVDLSAAARRELRALDSGARDRILRALVRLETHPRPVGAKKLQDRGELWRIRKRDHRIGEKEIFRAGEP